MLSTKRPSSLTYELSHVNVRSTRLEDVTDSLLSSSSSLHDENDTAVNKAHITSTHTLKYCLKVFGYMITGKNIVNAGVMSGRSAQTLASLAEGVGEAQRYERTAETLAGG